MLSSDVKLLKHRHGPLSVLQLPSPLLLILLFPVLLQPYRGNKQEVDSWWDVPGGLWRPVSVSKNTHTPSFTFHYLHVKWVIMSLTSLRDGTTDITRTVHWGTPTAMQKVMLWILQWKCEEIFTFLLSKHKRLRVIHTAVKFFFSFCIFLFIDIIIKVYFLTFGRKPLR